MIKKGIIYDSSQSLFVIETEMCGDCVVNTGRLTPEVQPRAKGLGSALYSRGFRVLAVRNDTEILVVIQRASAE